MTILCLTTTSSPGCSCNNADYQLTPNMVLYGNNLDQFSSPSLTTRSAFLNILAKYHIKQVLLLWLCMGSLSHTKLCQTRKGIVNRHNSRSTELWPPKPHHTLTRHFAAKDRISTNIPETCCFLVVTMIDTRTHASSITMIISWILIFHHCLYQLLGDIWKEHGSSTTRTRFIHGML